MASSRDRQRKLARAKLDRQMARRAVRERRRRRILAGVGSAAAVLLIVAGVAWIGGAFDSDDKDDIPAASDDQCVWSPQSTTANTSLKEVGTPPTKDIPTEGMSTMTITTNQGAPIVVSMDRTASTCGVASITYLAGKGFYNNTECHEVTTFGALRCGDPSGTGLGGPTYTFADENVPQAPSPSPSAPPRVAPLYMKGTVALIGDRPGANGSQFLIFFKDYSPATPEYSILGHVTGDMATVAALGKIPTVANSNGEKVKPAKKVVISSLTVGEAGAPAAPSASPQS